MNNYSPSNKIKPCDMMNLLLSDVCCVMVQLQVPHPSLLHAVFETYDTTVNNIAITDVNQC